MEAHLKGDSGDVDEGVATAVVTLDLLAKRHYLKPGGVASLLADVDSPLGRRQFSRLLGVMVKEPFAIERVRAPSESTHAVIALDWKDDNAVRETSHEHWQFAFMQALMSQESGVSIEEVDAYAALTHYKHETSLGKFVFQAFRKRICGDAESSKAIRDAVAAAKRSGVRLVEPTTANISVGLASMVAVVVSSRLPQPMAAVSAPVVGAIALLLLQVGVDGFCAWSRQVIEEAEESKKSDS